jgi:hypothetical protein
MAKYLHKSCPRCHDYFGVVVNQHPGTSGEQPISGYCAGCGYHLKGWRLIAGGKRAQHEYDGRARKVRR